MVVLETFVVGTAVAKVLLRVADLNDVADGLGDAVSGAEYLRRLLRREKGAEAVAAQIAVGLDEFLSHEFPRAQDHDRAAAIENVKELLEQACDEPQRLVEAVIDPARLHAYLLTHGGTKRRRSLGGDAGRIFLELLQASVDHIARSMPVSKGFSAAALTRLLRVSDELLAQVDSNQQSLQSLRDEVTDLISRAALNPRASVEVELHRRVIQLYAPPLLLGRTEEIAELESLATQTSDVWRGYRAQAQSGKTAVMATFALNPPPNVHVVPFFVRASQHDANDRSSFLERVLPHLARLAGENSVSIPSTAVRQGNEFCRLLEAAAQECRGKRPSETIILLIDGLDEDVYLAEQNPRHGSITSLLPAGLPEGVRVLVASRHNPPLPRDLGHDHPLRRTDVWRELSVSEHARARFNREDILDFMSTPAGRGIAALLAASGGPLTEKNLVSLANLEPPTVNAADIYRVIARAPGRLLLPVHNDDWDEPQPEAYLLGHGLIVHRVIAELDDALEEDDLPADDDPAGWKTVADRVLHPWRDRIARWAENIYAAKSWPSETPIYLLSDAYPALLLTRHNSREILVRTLTDRARIERLIINSGTSYAAVRQLRRAAADIVAANEPGMTTSDFGEMTADDLCAVGALALALYSLALGRSQVPEQLPAVFAKLGKPRRATHLALSISDLQARAEVLAGLAALLAEAGDPRRSAVAQEALELARSIRNPQQRTTTLMRVTPRLAVTGGIDLALAAAGEITHPWKRACALANGAQLLADSSDLDRARPLAEEALRVGGEEILDPSMWTDALARAQMVVLAGTTDRSPISEWDMTAPWERVDALLWMATVLAKGGADEESGQAIERALTEARRIWIPEIQTRRLVEVAGALVQAGNVLQAVTVADEAATVAQRLSAGTFGRVHALTEVAGASVDAGDPARALAIAEEAAATAIEISDLWLRTEAFAEVAAVRIEAGDPAQADSATEAALAAARAYSDPWTRAGAFAVVAQMLTRVGDASGKAPAAAEEAIVAAVSVSDPVQRGQSLSEIVRMLASAGATDSAIAAARAITEPWMRADALADVASVLACAGDAVRAESLAEEALANSTAWQSLKPWHRMRALAEIATSLAEAGELHRALKLVSSITQPETHAVAVLSLAQGLIREEDLDSAIGVVGQINQPSFRAKVYAMLASDLAKSGHQSQVSNAAEAAMTIARDIGDPGERAAALAQVAQWLVEANDMSRGGNAAEEALAPARDISDPKERVDILMEVARALAGAGHQERARTIAQEAIVAVESINSFMARAHTRAEAQVTLKNVMEANSSSSSAREGVNSKVEQIKALKNNVNALVEAGEVDRATDLSQKVLESAEALELVASALVQAGQEGLATWHLAARWREKESPIGDWKLLHRLHPEVARRLMPIVDELIDRLLSVPDGELAPLSDFLESRPKEGLHWYVWTPSDT